MLKFEAELNKVFITIEGIVSLVPDELIQNVEILILIAASFTVTFFFELSETTSTIIFLIIICDSRVLELAFHGVIEDPMT